MARITIEDCLKNMDNAFDICALAGKRAKDLASGAEPLIDSQDKPTVIALREISAGKIGMDYFEISNKEKIESQLFGDGVSEEEVINELSQQIEDIPSTEATASTVNTEESTSEQIEAEDISSNHSENETDDEVVESTDASKPE
ncbi:MAG: DNA-directed RNA polymerase subunit omega [Gammaproteobacteria bacterium]|jgi:DNA-directed RNA polymerase subunit omega|nr:DNA-directed RNA polymerase subunit omega [Gammaproteobacteria bacterium]|tara:strand:+ start:160 stop:591 length:432 start_codon:yes stop_codon:yes gene_type:complete